MTIEHPLPKETIVKYLYAHAFRCAYDGCRRPLYRVDEQTGARVLNSRVCHINARREGGPRWDPGQSADDNRSEQNLVLMCVEHANTIDEQTTLRAYPADLLRQWKAKQLEEYERLKQGWVIDTEMAQEAIEASSSYAEIIIRDSTVHLGGEGGIPPCTSGVRVGTLLARAVVAEERLDGADAVDKEGLVALIGLIEANTRSH
jgi:hypothetical protein